MPDVQVAPDAQITPDVQVALSPHVMPAAPAVPGAPEHGQAMTEDLPQRPELSATLDGAEFTRWYWTKDKLAAFSRALGLPASGDKTTLAGRISAFLDGRAQPAAAPRPAAGRQLKEPLSAQTVVPHGQRCSQIVRAWFTDQLGPGFHFDAPMREFFATGDGTATLADALVHWANTRDTEPADIAPQFELNRFTRDWHRRNPGGRREDMLAAWKLHRSLPADRRSQVGPNCTDGRQ